MKVKLPFKHFLRRVCYYLSHPTPIWNGTKDTNWYIDTQSEFTIDTAEQLAGFEELVNRGNSFEGKKVKLGKDIVLNDIANWENISHKNEWTPIGTDNNPFKGTFDGESHIISGVYINKPNNNNQGLFGCIEMDKPNWQIRNLYVIAIIIGKASIGGITGQSRGHLNKQNLGYIIKGYSAVILTGHTDIGGLVGTSQGGSKMYKSRSVGVIKVPGVPKIGELIGNPDISGEPLCRCGCSKDIVAHQPNTIIWIEISDFERDLFRQIRNRFNQSPYRSFRQWSRYYRS